MLLSRIMQIISKIRPPQLAHRAFTMPAISSKSCTLSRCLNRWFWLTRRWWKPTLSLRWNGASSLPRTKTRDIIIIQTMKRVTIARSTNFRKMRLLARSIAWEKDNRLRAVSKKSLLYKRNQLNLSSRRSKSQKIPSKRKHLNRSKSFQNQSMKSKRNLRNK